MLQQHAHCAFVKESGVSICAIAEEEEEEETVVDKFTLSV